MSQYSAFGLLRGALNGQKHWQPAWRDPEPKSHYDIIIIGGGGHGLATAYYLAKVHGLKNIAVLEKGWIGGCLLYTSPSPRDAHESRMPSSA